MIVPLVIQLFPLHIVIFIEYKSHIKRAYLITGGNDVISLIYCFRKGGCYIQVVIKIYGNDFFTKCYGENNE